MINFDAVDFSESRSEEAGASIHFSDGGGVAKVRKLSKILKLQYNC